MLANILDSHPDFTVTQEELPIFKLVNTMAMSNHRNDLRELFTRYREKLNEHRFYADKSHPAIWFAEELDREFGEDAYFIGAQRGAMGSVASMLKHKAILTMMERWRDYPVPNPYLGINEDNVGSYMLRSTAEKCALKWKAHRDRMDDLQGRLNRLLIAQYEEVVANPFRFTAILAAFLSVPNRFENSHVNKGSLKKWKALTAQETDDINRVVYSR